MFFPVVPEAETLKALCVFPIYKICAGVDFRTGQHTCLRSSSYQLLIWNLFSFCHFALL